MTAKNDGGPAFPSVDGRYAGSLYLGMTLRQWYAGLAMQGYLASGCEQENPEFRLSAWAFAIADAMIAEGLQEGEK